MNEKTCSFYGCGRPAPYKEHCPGHYLQKKKGKELTPLRYWKRGKRSCSFDDCQGDASSFGLCNTHYSQSRNGIPLRTSRGRLPAKPEGATREKDGYIYEKASDHPQANSWGWIAQHRRVMSEVLGRPLLSTETVHHKNGVRDDNRPENLELWVRYQPSGQRVEDRVSDAIELLKRYAPETLA